MLKGKITAFGHQKQKFLQKVLGEDKTVDKEFEEKRSNWEKLNRLIAAIDRDLKKQPKLETFNVPLLSLGENIEKFFEDDEKEAKYGRDFKVMSQNIDKAVKEYLETQKQAREMVQDYLNSIVGLKAKVQERDNLLLDYDKWRNTVAKYKEKPPKEPAKVTAAEQKHQSYKEIYTTANENLLKELTELHTNRFSDFENAYNALITSQFTLFSNVGLSFETLDSSLEGFVAPRRSLPPVERLSVEIEIPKKIEKEKSSKSTEKKNLLLDTESDGEDEKKSLQPPSPLPKKSIERMKALFDFDPTEEGELHFKEDDIITIVEKDPESEWWKGEMNGKIGIFPSNYCEPLQTDEEKLKEEQRMKEIQARLKKEAEEKLKKEAEEKLKKEAEEKLKKEQQEKMKKESEAKQAEEKLRAEKTKKKNKNN